MSACVNCDIELADAAEFCHHCGQKQLLSAASRSEFLRHLWDTLTLINSPLKRTVIALWQNPGKFVVDYARGKQVGFLPPATFFIMILAIYLLLAPFVVDASLDQLKLLSVTEQQKNGESQRIIQYLGEHRQQLAETIKQGLNFFYFILPFTLIFWMPKKTLQPDEGLVYSASFYYVAMSLLFAIPFGLLILINAKFALPRVIAMLSYLVFAFRRFYQHTRSRSLVEICLRTLAGFLTYVVGVMLLMTGWIVGRALLM